MLQSCAQEHCDGGEVEQERQLDVVRVSRSPHQTLRRQKHEGGNAELQGTPEGGNQ